MRWTQGRQEIDQLLTDNHLERVPPNREHADLLMAQARRHLESASKLTDDPEAGYAVLYDAARKSLWAVLVNQGLRPTTRGSHLTAYQAVRAQLHPPMGEVLRPFDRIRRERKSAEYPKPTTQHSPRRTSSMTCPRWRPSSTSQGKSWIRCRRSDRWLLV